jgi:hypothetical protein
MCSGGLAALVALQQPLADALAADGRLHVRSLGWDALRDGLLSVGSSAVVLALLRAGDPPAEGLGVLPCLDQVALTVGVVAAADPGELGLSRRNRSAGAASTSSSARSGDRVSRRAS